LKAFNSEPLSALQELRHDPQNPHHACFSGFPAPFPLDLLSSPSAADSPDRSSIPPARRSRCPHRFGDIYVIRPSLNSFYNAAIVQYRHDFGNGYQITSSYTWSKTVSDYPWLNTLGANGSAGYGIGGFQYPHIDDRGETNQSHRHRFVFSGIWAPAYGGNWPAFAKVPFTASRLTGILTLESGDTLTVMNAGPSVACPTTDAGTPICPSGYGSSVQDGAGFDELNVSGDPNMMDVRGDSGLGTVRGPGQNNLDLSLAKTFSLYERLHLEFRGDAFNALNHTQWTTTYPGGDAEFPFGMLNGAREARIGQVGAKLVF
jgi:hypothetical protein